MKITINVDCTPEEARSFMGLPDVKPMQEMMMKEVEERFKSNLSAMDPETLFKTWLPAGMANMEQFQKLFWSQFNQGTRDPSADT